METVSVDFHNHTFFSDSTRSPSELVRCFLNAGIQYASITDHDTLAVYQKGRLEEVAAELAVPFVAENGKVFRIGSLVLMTGVELSTKHNDKNQHLIGLGLSAIDAPDTLYFEQLKEDRKKRAGELIAAIDERRKKKEGIYKELGDRPLSFEEFCAEINPEAIPTRLHLGAYLYKHYPLGTSPRDAMNIAVNRNLDAYSFSSHAMSTELAIQFVHQHHGIAIIPHLHRQSFSDIVRRGPVELGKVISTLKEAGLDGIEINPEDKLNPMYEEIARELELLVTVGTDDHGENGPTYYKARMQDPERVKIQKYHMDRLRERLGISPLYAAIV